MEWSSALCLDQLSRHGLLFCGFAGLAGHTVTMHEIEEILFRFTSTVATGSRWPREDVRRLSQDTDERTKEEWWREGERGVKVFILRRLFLCQEDQEIMSNGRGWSQDDDERMNHGFTESEAHMRRGVCTRMYRSMLIMAYDGRIGDMMSGDR